MKKTRQSFNLISGDALYQAGIGHYLLQHFAPHYQNYFVLALIGTQSSGKSTLLNRLFQTNFQTMCQSEQRTRTTKGIWSSVSNQFLVMDMEGSDSAQRQEESKNFQNSIALFGLSLSNVLLVNVWTSEVGRYQATQYRIIKTIMQINLKIFKQDSTKTIMFVLRDFEESTQNLDQLTKTISDDILSIWKQIQKPKELANKSYELLFQVKFFALPSLKYEAESFEKRVGQLGLKLKEMMSESDLTKNIPIQSFESFSKNVWNSIKQNKDLNLPSEKLLISSLRCKEIQQQIFASLLPISSALKLEAQAKRQQNLVERMQRLLEENLSKFKKCTGNYALSVRETSQRQIQGKIRDEFLQIFQLNFTLFKKQLFSKVNQMLEQLYNSLDLHSHSVSASVQNILLQVLPLAEQYLLLNCSLKEVRDKSKRQIHKVWTRQLNNFKEKSYQKLRGKLLEKCRLSLLNEFNILYEQFEDDIWPQFFIAYNSALSDLEQQDAMFLRQLQQAPHDSIVEQFYLGVIQQVKSALKGLKEKICYSFHNSFIRDQKGMRDFKLLRREEADHLYQVIKRDYLQRLQNFRHLPIKAHHSHSDFQPSTVNQLISKNQFTSIRIQLEDQFLQSYSYALFEQRSGIESIPKWLWVLLIFFSYDDLLGLVSYPLLYYPTMMLLLSLGLFVAMGMEDIPIVVTEQIMQQFQKKITRKR